MFKKTMISRLRSKIPKIHQSLSRFLSTHPNGLDLNPNSVPQKLTSAHYDHLITEAGHSRDFPTIQSLLTERIRSGCFNTTNTFKFLTEADPSTLLPPLIETIYALQRGYGRKNAFDSLVAHLSKSHPHHARYVLDVMLHRNISPNVCSFYPLISSLSRKKKLSDVTNLLDFMKEKSIPPDTTCYNYVLSALCHLGDLTTAGRTLNAMLEEGLVPDSLTFDALVLGACRVGRFDGAVALVRRMEVEEVKGLYCTYGHIIRGLLEIGRYTEAVEFVRGVGGRDGRLDSENYGVLGRGLVRRERWKEMTIVVREMKDMGLEIDEKLMDAYHLNLVKEQ